MSNHSQHSSRLGGSSCQIVLSQCATMPGQPQCLQHQDRSRLPRLGNRAQSLPTRHHIHTN
ncbi:uncharacterized protein B0I36DRAFT_329590 [Microdochium trichocladiopsis]|uniref:Uncharacterized protein n=1 Tax=Microdochium trichocladiopsis TaxID=1682393 RepID=A0A9P8XZF6_9PEZI|nr:uncharacterized protein B0I36DRAFT_329590 [Microdochium trichocladiopsis]KAH7025967.1 hypothetical protein B0I36DRAFT_329590 [Microdochium trichocladiopsis]